MTTLSSRTAALIAMLTGPDTPATHLDVFDGEPKAVMDGDGQAHPYAAVYTSPGWSDPIQDSLCGLPGELSWSFQVTAAGGDLPRARAAVDRVLDRILGQRLVVGGVTYGIIRLSTDPGPVITDKTQTPYRSFCPLLFTVHL